MKHILTIILITIFCSTQAQDNSLYTKQVFIQKNDTLPYRLLLPINYDKTKTYPLVIFLHGSGERGNDNEAQLSHGADLFLRDSIRQKYPAIIMFPQCSQSSDWSNAGISRRAKSDSEIFTFKVGGAPTTAMKLLINMLADVQKKYRVNKKQLYISGLSMGGFGTFEMVKRLPNTFAAAMPMCGGANPLTAKLLTKTNWWVFHGGKDDIVNPMFSKNMAAAIKAKGGNVKLSVYENDNHNCWDSAFGEPTFMQWMFAQHK